MQQCNAQLGASTKYWPSTSGAVGDAKGGAAHLHRQIDGSVMHSMSAQAMQLLQLGGA